VQRWYDDRITLMAVTFPVYAAEGWPAWIKGSGSHGGDLTRLVIAYADAPPDSMFVERPRVEVTTSLDAHQPSELAVARDALRRVSRPTPTGDPPTVSPMPPSRFGSVPPATVAWPVLTKRRSQNRDHGRR
jgi:hypothetical protein